MTQTAPNTSPGPACWSCGQLNDAYMALERPATPHAGAISICAYCAALAVFTGDGLETRRPTPLEVEEFAGSTTIRKALAAVRSFNITNPRRTG